MVVVVVLVEWKVVDEVVATEVLVSWVCEEEDWGIRDMRDKEEP